MDSTNRYRPAYLAGQSSLRAREAVIYRLKGESLTQEDAEAIIAEVKMCTALPKEEE